MKFLCTDCDTAMKFKDVTRPAQGSVTALFECPDCFTEIAMFLNPSETQMLKSLDLKLGGNNEVAQPMQMVRSQLETAKTETMPNEFSPGMGSGETAEGGKCPFTGVISDAFQEEPEPVEAERSRLVSGSTRTFGANSSVCPSHGEDGDREFCQR